MLQNHLKYNQDCSPLLHYRFAYRANSCGNAIANLLGSLHTGKERDSETGFSYFGARYYDSDILTGWLSVDPMADKYPGLSPYAYCGWNPVRLVDPNGEDIWELDVYGHITKYERTTEFDKFVILNENGNTVEKIFDYGTITDWRKPSIRSKGIDYKSDIFRVNGDNNAKELFEFFADNTLVEWTHAKIGSEDSEKNIVGTIHQTSKTNIGGYLRETNYTLREVNHNHPAGFPPSDTDKTSAKSYIEKFPNIRLNVYTRKDKYIPYDANQHYKSSIELPELHISDKKL